MNQHDSQTIYIYAVPGSHNTLISTKGRISSKIRLNRKRSGGKTRHEIYSSSSLSTDQSIKADVKKIETDQNGFVIDGKLPRALLEILWQKIGKKEDGFKDNDEYVVVR
jgi:hypothetical protein